MSSEATSRRESQDFLILQELVNGGSYQQAAEAARVSPRTVRRRMADPDFASEVRALRSERASQLSAKLQSAGNGAADLLLELIGSPDAPLGLRVRAASILLTSGARARRDSEWSDRLDELERRLQAGVADPPGGRDGVA